MGCGASAQSQSTAKEGGSSDAAPPPTAAPSEPAATQSSPESSPEKEPSKTEAISGPSTSPPEGASSDVAPSGAAQTDTLATQSSDKTAAIAAAPAAAAPAAPAEPKPDESAPVGEPTKSKAVSGATRGKRKDRAKLAKRVQARSKTVDWSSADPSKWMFPEVEFSGSYSFHQQPVLEEVSAVISKGNEQLKAEPHLYDGLYYQSNMVDWPEDQQQYKFVKRTGSGFQVTEAAGGGFTWVEAKYQVLTPDVEVQPDAFTDSMNYGGYALAAPRMPGRGSGCADVPSIKVIDVAHPRDVSQGGVGDCWLLCSMSAVAEYKGVIQSLFKNTTNITERPLDTFNQYTITLYDLSSPEWKPVDVVIDERLCSKPDNSSLLGAHPTLTGELWVCYLEKAIAAHCGGWDEINGGTCTHAWRLLLGCKHVYTFKKKDDGFECFGTFNPNTNEWEQLDNSPHKGFQALWPMVWPEVGGGGGLDLKLNDEDFFDRMCAWDDENYIMACGSEAGSDKEQVEGIVQGHAYTILECMQNPGGADVDLIKVRNPWGKGEFTAGKWTDEGSGWAAHPEVKAACNPKDADDGCFWMEKDEFFEFFPTVYLCALDMTGLQKDLAD